MKRLIAALAVPAAVATALVTTAAAPAAAAACVGGSGVTVVVDFGTLPGGIVTNCAPGDPTSGLSALTGAGFGYAFVPTRPGLICQINVKPNPCNGAPVSAYWSYWHGTPGGSWTYSSSGAGGYNPAPGTVEGWRFGSGQAPGTGP